LKLGVIADDFTGASDIALTLAEGGMSVAQFNGIPTGDVPVVDAGVVSLKSRTAPVDEAISLSLAACDWLESQGCTQIIYKVCSTFDSTSDGNIGQVTQELAEHLGETRVAICPAFPENGRSVYQGHLFVADRLLNESGMQNHPLTPMTDPDLRRVMAAQTSWPVDHISTHTVFQGPEAIAEAMKGPAGMVLIDAIRDADLLAIGKALSGRKLMTGGSGIALGLPGNFDLLHGDLPFVGRTGPGVVLSGSCSIATRGQVERYKTLAPSREIEAKTLMKGGYDLAELVDWVLQQDQPPLIYSSADPAVVAAAQETFGGTTIAENIENLFANLAASLADRGVERIVVAGGETSGAVVTGLSADVLEIGPRIAAGVPAVSVSDRSLNIALKSGNFGDVDFFEQALDVLKGTA